MEGVASRRVVRVLGEESPLDATEVADRVRSVELTGEAMLKAGANG